MSCHSTPGNLAVLGYCSGSYELDSPTVESEFHWLKRVGRDKQFPAPSPQQWQEFCDQYSQWVAHDENLGEVRRARLADRITAARSDTPDAATFYALENLPARLQFVTDPQRVRETVTKVQRYTDQAAKTGRVNIESFRDAVYNLRQAESVLRLQSAPDPADLPDDVYSLTEEAAEVTEMLDVYLDTLTSAPGQATREHVYQAHRWIASALRHLKRRSVD